VTAKLARSLLVAILFCTGFGFFWSPIPGARSNSAFSLWAGPAQPGADRFVFVAGGLSEEKLIILTANLAASKHPGLFLLDTPKTKGQLKVFLDAYRPKRVIPLGSFPDGVQDLERRLDMRVAPVLPWNDDFPSEFWTTLFPRADQVVVCPAKSRRLLLQSACLAGVMRSPLLVAPESQAEVGGFQRQLDAWQTRKVVAVGDAIKVCRTLPNTAVVKMADEQAVAASYLRHQLKKGPIRNLVIANPEDIQKGVSGMSFLSPWVALQRRAVLLLTNEAGSNVAPLVDEALANRELAKADTLILVADLKSMPMEQRPNPIVDGKDQYIEMEPLTPLGTEPFTFATGRLFHEDPGVVVLMLARQRLLAEANAARRALVVSNPGCSLPLLETFSRSTAKELFNGGYQTTTLLGNEVNKDDMRRLLPEQDIFLWEGHYNTLIKEYEIHEWNEPLRPSLVFLQSCLALQESKAQPFLQRGAVSVVGSSTRTYSATGGACSLAFFDALLYEGQSLGSSLRHAKNFLLAYSLLKEKRLGTDAKLTGANVRSAWAFSLWGDPTLKLPRPETPDVALPPVHHKVQGNTIVVTLPDTAHEQSASNKYKAHILPNQRLAGLVTKNLDDGRQRLVPFVFAEVHLPKAPFGKIPQLRSRLPSTHWVFCWDKRRQCGYLLLTPRAKDKDEIRFHIQWDNPAVIAQSDPDIRE
jgi:hypothetical protein